MKPPFMFFCMTGIIYLAVSVLLYFLLKRLMFKKEKWFASLFWSVEAASVVYMLSAGLNLDNAAVSSVVIRVITVWLIAKLIALVPLLILFLLQRLCEKTDVDRGRRDFIKYAAAAAAGSAMAASGYGAYNFSHELVFNRYDVALKNLPKNLSGYKVAQLSDVHIGLFFSAKRLESLLKDIVKEQCDVLVITGDLIDDTTQAQAVADILNRYAASFPQGIYFCWGNHEYMRNFPAIEQALSGVNITILKNASRLLKYDGGALYIAGVDYPKERETAARQVQCSEMVDEAIKNVPKDACKLLLTHHPSAIEEAFAQKVDLTLAGHTHGGQIWLFGVNMLPVYYKYMRGFYENDDCFAYVNVGAGGWFPIRIGCAAEVSVFKLHRRELGDL